VKRTDPAARGQQSAPVLQAEGRLCCGRWGRLKTQLARFLQKRVVMLVWIQTKKQQTSPVPGIFVNIISWQMTSIAYRILLLFFAL
jgi:hypothetical protein